MSWVHLPWLSTGSTLRPITFAPRLANSLSRAATAPSSVVQTGVKSLGWEKSTAQLSPIHSWKWMVPCVVSAVKSGARSLMRSDISFPRFGFSVYAGPGSNSLYAFSVNLSQRENPPGLAPWVGPDFAVDVYRPDSLIDSPMRGHSNSSGSSRAESRWRGWTS